MNCLNLHEINKLDFEIKTSMKYSVEKDIIKISTAEKSFCLPLHFDIFKITGLIFDVNPEEHVDWKDTIVIVAGEDIIQSTNAKLLVNCNGYFPIESENKFIVPTTFQFNTCLLSYQQPEIFFNFSNPLINHISLQVETIKCDKSPQCISEKTEILTYNNAISEKIKVNDTQCNYIVKTYRRITGYYITGNISNIKSISIAIGNGHNYGKKIFSCDLINLGIKCIRVSHNTIFVPLDTFVINELTKEVQPEYLRTLFKDKTTNELFIIKIKFLSPENHIYLSKLNINLLRYFSGICGLALSHNIFYIKETHKNYQLDEKVLPGTTIIMNVDLEEEYYNNLPNTLEKLEFNNKINFKLSNLPVQLKKLRVREKPEIQPKIPFGCVYKIG